MSSARAPYPALSHEQAVAFLQEALPEQPPRYWSYFLINNRRTDRKPAYRIPVHKAGGMVRYDRDQLAAFVEFEKHRRLTGLPATGRAAELMQAYGIGSQSGGPYGRVFVGQITAQLNESGPHGQLVIKDPLLVFRLSPEQVQELAREFASVAKQLQKVKHEN